jgi:hypothetical protein
MTSTAYAGPIIFVTTTKITGNTQAQQNGSDPAVTVNFSVAASGGNNAPTGNVKVTVAGQSESCNANLSSSSGVTSTGWCVLTGLAPGSYQLQAWYQGASQYAKSNSDDYTLNVAAQSGGVITRLACPAAVNVGQSGNCWLVVKNNTQGTAVNVTGQISLPWALKARYCYTAGWWWFRCSIHNNNAIWHLGNLRAGASRTLVVHFTAQGPRWERWSRLVNVYGSATWGVKFPGGGPMQHVSVSKYRVEIHPYGFVF